MFFISNSLRPRVEMRRIGKESFCKEDNEDVSRGTRERRGVWSGQQEAEVKRRGSIQEP